MIKITKLEGFAGLRLKNNKPLEIKKGINLIVGRNGSGKSNLQSLIRLIFNDGFEIKKSLFETKFLNEYYSEMKINLEDHWEGTDDIDLNLQPLYDEHIECRSFCNYIFEGNDSIIKFKKAEKYNPNLGMLKKDIFEIGFNEKHRIFLQRTYEQNFKISIIQPKIELDNDYIRIEGGFQLFKPSSGNVSNNPIVNNIVTNFNQFFKNELDDFRLNNLKLYKKLEQLKRSIFKEYNNFFGQTNKKIELTLNPLDFNNKALLLSIPLSNYTCKFPGNKFCNLLQG